jgi:hypothetical protein
MTRLYTLTAFFVPFTNFDTCPNDLNMSLKTEFQYMSAVLMAYVTWNLRFPIHVDNTAQNGRQN